MAACATMSSSGRGGPLRLAWWGACKNLVKDRMEWSRMRWTLPMAGALLQLRAVYSASTSSRTGPFMSRKNLSDSIRQAIGSR
jgi:hypothetical protein